MIKLNENKSILFSKIPSVKEMTSYIVNDLMRNYEIKMTELSPYRDLIRFDIIGINRNKREIRIIEVKSSRQDFTSDKKWEKYLPYCTHFAFAAPKGVIYKDELPDGVGLIEFWYEEKWKHNYLWLQHKYVKGCSQLKETLDNDKYISLLEAITMRLLTEHQEHNNYNFVLDKLDKIDENIQKYLLKEKKYKI